MAEADLRADLRDGSRVVGAVVKFGESLVKFGFLLVVCSWALAFVAAVGAVLVAGRHAFIASTPFMLRHARIIVFFLNDVVIIALDVVINAFIVAIDAIFAIVDVFGGSARPLSFTSIPRVTYAEYESVLREVVTTCSRVDGLVAMWNMSVAPVVSRAACPYARAVYPLLGGTSLMNSTVGTFTVDPDPMANNCADVPGPSPENVALCMGLASGYVVLEVLLPLVVLGVFLLAAGHAIVALVYDAVEFAARLIDQAAVRVERLAAFASVLVWTCVRPRGKAGD